MAEKIHGKDMVVTVDGKSVAGAVDCQLTISVGTRRVASPTTRRYADNMARRKSWQVTTSHLLNLDNQIEVTSLIGKKVHVTMKKSQGNLSYTGWAWVSKVDAKATDKKIANGAFTFTGTGKLTMTK